MSTQTSNGTAIVDPFAVLFNGPALYEWITTHVLLTALVTVASIAISTRFQDFSPFPPPGSRDGKPKEPPNVPYWFPIVGHIPNMIWNATKFLRSLRDNYKDGAFSLNFGGTVHTIVCTPPLVTALLNVKDEHASHQQTGDTIGVNVFGFPMKTEGEAYRAAWSDVRACYHHMQSDAGLSDMVKKTAQLTKENVINLVSFTKSPVDQSYWERTAKAELSKDKNGHEVVAANMTDLIRDFCGINANPSVVGSDFLNNNPDFLADLWNLDRGFLLLAAGLPRWVPIPTVTRAHIARRNCLGAMAEFEEALDKYVSGQDPGVKWQNLDDVGAVIRGRVEVYRRYKFSYQARAAFDLGLDWATNANSNMLVFWMLNRAYADKELLARLRAEVAPYVKAVQPKKQLAIAEPPRLDTFDIDRLCSNCPLLKACYIEGLRVDAATWSFKAVKEDFDLIPREKSSTAFRMKKGQYIHAAHDLHNTDPMCFEEPEKFLPDRHIKVDESGRQVADMGSIRPYGGGHSMCKGRFFAYKECMIFAAAILVLWDMESVGGGEWKMPKPRKSTGVYSTNDPTRVWLRRREIPVA